MKDRERNSTRDSVCDGEINRWRSRSIGRKYVETEEKETYY